MGSRTLICLRGGAVHSFASHLLQGGTAAHAHASPAKNAGVIDDLAGLAHLALSRVKSIDVVYREPVDIRRSFEGLEALVREELQEDPLSGALFVFCNRRRDRAKLLAWDGTGFWICYKRLEGGDTASDGCLQTKARCHS